LGQPTPGKAQIGEAQDAAGQHDAAMSRHLTRLAAALLVLAVFPTAVAAKPLVVQVGNLVLRDNGGIMPSKLPRHEMAPVSARIEGRISTSDGTHPPPLTSVDVLIDKTIAVSPLGLPTCRRGRIEARTTVEAKKACPNAIVGSGSGEVEVAFPEQKPFSATGPIVLFNGGTRGGRTTLYIHAYVAVPAPTAVIATVTIARVHRGRYGIRALATLPPIANGSGSATYFRIEIGRRFTYRSRKRSFIEASCPTGTYFTKGEIRFAGGAVLRTLHGLPGTPEGGSR
jgi:hypothetical protein